MSDHEITSIALRSTASAIVATEEELAGLSQGERFLTACCEFFNCNPRFKAFQRLFLGTIAVAWVGSATRNLVRIENAKVLDQFTKDRTVILCSNHRSFFDMYVLSCWIMKHLRRSPNLLFPVRSSFFYDSALGLFVNGAMSMFAMFPPIFREHSKRKFNAYSVAKTIELARKPNTLIGVHPEGKRHNVDDPCELLPAKPGIGAIVQAVPEALVIPVFITGLSNDIVKQIIGNFNGKGAPIVIAFGEPLDLSALRAKPNTISTQQQIADTILDQVQKLGRRFTANSKNLPN